MRTTSLLAARLDIDGHADTRASFEGALFSSAAQPSRLQCSRSHNRDRRTSATSTACCSRGGIRKGLFICPTLISWFILLAGLLLGRPACRPELCAHDAACHEHPFALGFRFDGGDALRRGHVMLRNANPEMRGALLIGGTRGPSARDANASSARLSLTKQVSRTARRHRRCAGVFRLAFRIGDSAAQTFSMCLAARFGV